MALDTLPVAGLPTRAGIANRPEVARDPLRTQAEELEGVFLNTLVSEMFKGLQTDSMFGGGHAEETWRGMLTEQYASEMARSGGIGLADQIVSSLIQAQGAIPAASIQTAIGAYSR